MKKTHASSAATATEGSGSSGYISAANPYLPLWEHLPDGEPRVFEDPDNPGKYRAYIIGSHDVKLSDYCGVDIRIWSAPVEDLSRWRDEGPVFTFRDPVSGEWDIMFAPDLVEVLRRDKNGERTIREYYLYPHSRGPGREAMVAKSSRPDGPFEPVNIGSDGRTLVPGSIMGFDPSIYIEYIDDPNDPDYDIGFRAYGYWGFQKSHAAQLDQSTMYSVRPGTQITEFFIPASNSYGDIRDPEGTQYPHVYQGQDLGAFNFFEAASIRKVGNKFVWVYSGYSGPDYGIGSSNSTLRYAYGDSPLGPWKSGGVLVDSRGPVPNKDGSSLEESYPGHNTHGSIEQIGGQWYAFYHRAPRGFGYARQPMVAPVRITWDEAPVAEGGTVRITGWNTDGSALTARAGEHEYTGAEVTSEGFHIYGLDPFRYYSAGIACYLSDRNLQDDAWDIWQDHAPINNVSDGHIIGYKYFGFGGLAEDTAGIHAFEGTGSGMMFNVFLEPLTQQEFKINVWLDGPWDNDVWNGKKLGEITVPVGLNFEVSKISLDISELTGSLTGKRAVYLEFEGPSPGALCNLIGLGFSAKGKEISRPVVPQISITSDGVPLILPREPVRATPANGITGYNIYQIDYELTGESAKLPQFTASSDDIAVDITVTQPQPDDETVISSISFDYKGAVKTYNVVFSPISNLTEPYTPPSDVSPSPGVSMPMVTNDDEPWLGEAWIEEAPQSRLLTVLGGIIGAAALCTGLYFIVKKMKL